MNPATGGHAAPAPLPRHTLAWPATAARADLLSQAIDAGARVALARWLDAALPLVVRRADASALEPAPRVHLGLPLPPDQGKRRLAFVLAPKHVSRCAPPPTLQRVGAALPVPWRRPLAALDRDARDLGVTLRVFGSAAWQTLTGFAYLRAGSDVDLLLRPDSSEQLDATLELFDRFEAAAGLRIDAEILFADDRAVAWREWRQAASADDRVLVKSLAGAALARRADLCVEYAGAAA